MTIVKQTFAELKKNSCVLQAINSEQKTINEGNTLYEHIFNSKFFFFFLLFELDTCILSDNKINSILSKAGLNSFHVQCRLLHVVSTTDGEKMTPYFREPMWESEKFTECT